MSNFRSVFLSTFLAAIAVVIPLISDTSSAADHQNSRQIKVNPLPTPDGKPPFPSYRNISIGMKAEEVRKTLGEPRSKSNEEDFYMYGEDESLQIIYDASQSVTAISVTLFNDLSKAPSAKTVIGEDVKPNPEGAIFKSVRYPKAGFWVSYSKTAGDSPTISITLQKI